MSKDRQAFKFPKSFSAAKKKLKARYGNIDDALLEDSIQYAQIEFWIQRKEKILLDDSACLNWLLKVARFYLSKETRRINRFQQLSEVMHYSGKDNTLMKVSLNEALENLGSILGEKNASIVLNHLRGFSLSEIAIMEKISVNATKKRHARALSRFRKIYEIS